MAVVVEFWVKNEKGTEYVGAAVGEEEQDATKSMSKLVFSDYSRSKEVVSGEAFPSEPHLSHGEVMELTCKSGKIPGFRDYLKGRGKAAVARVDETRVVAMLPSGSDSKIRIAVFSSAKRRRKKQEEVALAQVPEWGPRWRDEDNCMVFRDGENAVYFQDARRRFEFRCGRLGLELLRGLLAVSKKTLDLLERELASLDPTARASLLEEGRKIYGEKPSLRKFGHGDSGKNVTWSDDEYAHAGLRAQYLRLKSIQRFSETYNLLQRAAARDQYVKDVLEREGLRCASLGGGPAFELYALEMFASPPLKLYSLDLQPAWKPYAEALGCTFAAPFDVHKATADDLVQACDSKPLDILVISYLLIYCTTPRTADLFAELLRRNLVKVLIISERTHKQGIVQLLQQRDIVVIPLMSQQREVDQRQLIALLPERVKSLVPPKEADYIAFPNVPFARGT